MAYAADRRSGASVKADLESAHQKAMEQQRANTPIPGMGGGDGTGKAPKGAVKTTGTYKGKSNKLGYGGRAAQLKAKGVPGGVIGELARKAHAAKGQVNYHGK